MKRAWAILFLAGLAVATLVVSWIGFGTVVETVREAGWGVLILMPLYLLPLWLATLSWRLLLPEGQRLRFGAAIVPVWIGLAVNWLLPVGQVGGEIVKARWAVRRGVPSPEATASVVADKTLQVITQIIFALVGIALLGWLATDFDVLVGAVVGTGAFGAGVAGFLVLQRRGMFRLSAAIAKKPARRMGLRDFGGDASRFDEALGAVYADRVALIRAGVFRMAFRLALVIETGVALQLLGHPSGLAKVIALEALGQTVRAGSFLIPAGIGVQEGAFAGLAVALGIPAPVGLAVSLCKRARELLVGVPALLYWQASIRHASSSPERKPRGVSEMSEEE